SNTDDGQDWIATAVQGGGCDLFWPCIDNPLVEPEAADIYFTVDKHLVAASNGRLQSVTESNDRKTFHWRTENSINNYAISVNIGPYELLKSTYQSNFGNTLDLVYYYVPRKDDKTQQLFSEIPRMLAFFEQMIGPYPFANDKVGIVDTPHMGMEHQTINGYGNGFKKSGYGFDTILQHEFAHEWFANQLTNNNLDHLWLHEGFGTYMQPLYAQYLAGERPYQSYLHDLRKGIVNKFPLVSNKVLNDDQVYNDAKGPGQDLYQKGALVLHTLRQLIGDDAFFTATRELVYGMKDPKPGMFKPRLSDTNEFIELVNKTTGKDFQWFFDVYLFQAELPILEQTRAQSKLMLNWKAPNDSAFPMPLEVSINGVVSTLAMTKAEELAVTLKDIVIIDPMSKILRQEKAIDAYQDYEKENKK
ncbi:MAG: M1 family metallopeptidase, partial [Marinicella sp.]